LLYLTTKHAFENYRVGIFVTPGKISLGGPATMEHCRDKCI